MIVKSNVHTHTVFCDGAESIEEMVIAAIGKGMHTLGFSFHSFTPFDRSYCIRDYEGYMRELDRVREKYSGRINILNGVELDLYGERPENCDYVIGSVHYFEQNGRYYAIDLSSEDFTATVNGVFGGDYYAAAERYFEEYAQLAGKIAPDIYGHYDLITRFNAGGRLFDESSPRYVRAALCAAESLPFGAVVEVNLGRLYKGAGGAYPAEWLIRELAARGCRFMLSSDAHCSAALGFAFDEQCKKLASLGVHSLVFYRGNALEELKI